jgi:hypothetical protein
MAARILAFVINDSTARLAWMDSGTGNAYILVYGTDQPAVPGAAAGGSALLRIDLAKPAGIVGADGTLQMVLGPATPGIGNGTAKWGRLFNGADVAGLDLTLTGTSGAGDIKLSNRNITVGAAVKVVAGTLR